jgi:ABC-type polysaccharide/polyol phosphate transport system ATPase subunit
VGDGEFRRKCFERIEQFRTLGKTILFVSHDLGGIRQFCERVLLLHGGELIEDGPADFVISRYEALLAQHVDSLRTQAW